MRALILACAIPASLALALPSLAAPAWACGHAGLAAQSAPMLMGTDRPAPGVWTLIPPWPDTADTSFPAALRDGCIKPGQAVAPRHRGKRAGAARLTR